MSNYPDKVYLNGEILPSEKAQVSVFDRGFIFGDGIYEAMAQINGVFFYEEAHLSRLAEGLAKIRIQYDVSQIPKEINYLLESSDLIGKDCFLYLQITRGVAPRQHAFPKDIQPTVFMYALPKVLPDINTIHAKVITREDFRWSRCDIKMTSLLGNVMLNEEAMQHECYETVLCRNGVVTEASHCNVFFVKDNVVYTHPANEFILNGITRLVVIQLCGELGLELKEEAISEDEIYNKDEAFLTGTSTQIASIQQINDHSYYTDSTVGPVTKKLQEAFHHLKGN
ncbi:aminotransferase class IV [Maribacter sp. PR1]|uniref:Aminotransferase class IV n=1 Tax=Maribacter cobaltidurans TaxID=1178778 RepID=A0ABU7ISX3_9FLAO|nr:MULTISPECIES: aminotransferase class IV [Maribacter]MDC6388492.1 aminotransferase class IV [Maribacter sp. PR1]MEE1975881.1 aminotransferase class IV [Maribacter cobaltidurans]